MFDNLTYEELLQKLRSMTVDQLKTVGKNWIDERSKRQLIVLIMVLKTLDIDTFEIQDQEEGEDGPNGQIWRIRTVRDVLGQFIRREKFNWTYHPGIEGKRIVHLITRTSLDVNGKAIGEPEVIARHSPNGEVISRV